MSMAPTVRGRRTRFSPAWPYTRRISGGHIGFCYILPKAENLRFKNILFFENPCYGGSNSIFNSSARTLLELLYTYKWRYLSVLLNDAF